MKTISLLGLALAATSVLTSADLAMAQNPAASIEQRQQAMKMNGAAMKAMVPIVRGEQPWNQAVVIQSLDTLKKNAEATPSLFPRGSGPETGIKTAALPVIWEKWAEFQAAAKNAADTADNLLRLARANDEAGVKSGFGAMGRACGTCHETFRAKQ